MLSPSWCFLWLYYSQRHAAQRSTYAKNFPPPTLSLMLGALRPSRAALSHMVVTKCLPKLLFCYFSNLQLEGFMWTWWEAFLSAPSFHCDTDTADFYRTWESAGGTRGCQGHQILDPFLPKLFAPLALFCFVASSSACSETAVNNELINILWSGFPYLACS